jgi:hypothetical protein
MDDKKLCAYLDSKAAEIKRDTGLTKVYLVVEHQDENTFSIADGFPTPTNKQLHEMLRFLNHVCNTINRNLMVLVICLSSISLSVDAQSYDASKMRTPKRLHAKQHGVKVLLAPMRQKIKYYRKRRKAIS